MDDGKTLVVPVPTLAPGTLRGAKGVPRKGVGTSVNMRVCTCKEVRVKHNQTICFLRPPLLGTPLVPFLHKPLLLYTYYFP